MPFRPRQHELEELSRREFRQLLPARWVVRDVTPDYGVDEQVEIFDESGEATGLEFYAQLKGTDQPLPAALAVSLRSDHADYYSTLALPVLMCRLHAPSGRFFATWFHAYDPHYGASQPAPGRRTFTFRWSEADEWATDTPARLVAEVEAFRRFRSGRLGFPVAFYFEAEPGTVPAQEAFLAVRALAERVPRVIDVRQGPVTAGQALLRIEADRALASLAGVASVSVHRSWQNLDAVDDHDAADALLAVGLVLLQIGHADAAAQVIRAAEASPILGQDPESTFRSASAFVQSGRLSDALRVARTMGVRSDEDGEMAEAVFSLAALDSSVPEEIREEYRSVIRERISRREARGDLTDTGADFYNLANSYRSSRAPRPAVRNYVMAARRDPRYKSRPYFWHELGGMLFETDHFHLASDCYSRAVELGGEDLSKALYADALLYAGQFHRSQELFEEAADGAETDTAEWRLKRRALAKIREVAGDQQSRRPDSAQAQFAAALEHEPDEARNSLVEALALDALCGDAWFVLAALAYEDNPGEAAELMVIAALARRYDPATWLAAFGLEWQGERDDQRMLDIATAGDFLVGEEFRRAVVEWARMPEQRDESDAILEVLNRAHEREPRDEGFIVRFGSDEGYDEFVFEPPDAT